ncbi:MAG TPA: hypothetical protein VNS22_13835 [Geminicoccus sp.]|uniref:hypothetical protein n=1 Tax=Geminicoccus sp. TaxID=2024832 RepID=UPI002C8995BE|nr:hypothetical protein [Geminicoccus sp.]HWL69448.1 hypothetical protein [Geminicoccus sp.]
MKSHDAVAVGLLLAALCAMLLFGLFSVAQADPVLTATSARAQPTQPSAGATSPTPPPVTPRTYGASPATETSRLPMIEYVSASAIQNHPGMATASAPAWTPPRQPPSPPRSAFDPPMTPPQAAPPAAASNGAAAQPPFGSEGVRGRFTDADWNEKSFLKLMGYQVGVSGISAWRRQDILRRAYERPLPADMPAAMRAECGAPGSSVRLQRIVRHLRFCIAMARPRAANLTKALSEWQADIAWLQATFGALHRDVDFR